MLGQRYFRLLTVTPVNHRLGRRFYSGIVNCFKMTSEPLLSTLNVTSFPFTFYFNIYLVQTSGISTKYERKDDQKWEEREIVRQYDTLGRMEGTYYRRIEEEGS